VSYDRPTQGADLAEFRHAYWKVLFTGDAAGATGATPAAPR
jgi:hypothetical protein